MKRFNVVVNGVSYDVCVEEATEGMAAVSAPAPAPVAAPAPKKVEAPAAPAASASANTGKAGSVVVKAPMPGNIMKINFKVGDSVKRGDVLVVLEAMKMENDICAPEDGTVSSVNVAQGATVSTDEVLVTLA